MLKILLIRPGTTEYDLQGRVQGALDVPLCEQGYDEVRLVAKQLRDEPIEALYTAPCSSAVQTADVIAEACDLKAKKLENIQNLDHGLWQGMLIKDVKKKQPKVFRQWQEQPETVCPPNGETVADVRQRIQKVFSKLNKKHKDSVIALVAPEPLASVIRNVLRQDKITDFWNGKHAASWETIPVEPRLLAAAR